MFQKENQIKSYLSKAKGGYFIFTYFSFMIGGNSFNLIKVEYPSKNPQQLDVLFEIPKDDKEIRIIPSNLENYFSIEQNKEASFKRKEKFYESYGFTFSYDQRFEAEIEKIVLIKKR